MYKRQDAGGKVKVTGASDHKVNLVGNLYASKDDGNGDNTYYFRDGAINLGLTTSDSTWSGVVSNTNKNTPTGKSQQGDINLWLQNGATWNHEAVSRADAVYAAGNNGKTTLPSPSNGLYGAYDGISHLTTIKTESPDLNFTFAKMPVMDDYTDKSGMDVANWGIGIAENCDCLLYTSPSPRD